MVVAVLGAGRMGGALARGWVQAGVLSGSDLRLFRRNTIQLADLGTETGGLTASSLEGAVRDADVLLLSVKPQQIIPLLAEVKPFVKAGAIILSVAAGIRLDSLHSASPDNAPVLRAMPNTPAQIGAAASAFCRGRFATDEHAAIVQRLLQAVGVAFEVTEAQMDAVIGVAGSGVAYFYLLIEALTDGGVKAGLPRDVARQLAAQTALGAARMILETGEHPAALKDAVTTPGGTTISALASLEKAGVRSAMIEAVEAAAQRAKEII